MQRKENDQNDIIEKYEQKSNPPPSLPAKQRQSKSRRNVSMKDQNVQRSQLLELAMAWDCVDVAKELILQNSLDNILVRTIDS